MIYIVYWYNCEKNTNTVLREFLQQCLITNCRQSNQNHLNLIII